MTSDAVIAAAIGAAAPTLIAVVAVGKWVMPMLKSIHALTNSNLQAAMKMVQDGKDELVQLRMDSKEEIAQLRRDAKDDLNARTAEAIASIRSEAQGLHGRKR